MRPERFVELKEWRDRIKAGKIRTPFSVEKLSHAQTFCELVDYVEELTSEKIGVHDVVQSDWGLKNNESGLHVVTSVLSNGYFMVDYGLVIDCKGVQRIGKAKLTPFGDVVQELEEMERNRVWGE